jgi:hypothetical protein
MLEEDYTSQPLVVQEADLPEINRVRAELGMPLVDVRLKEIVHAAKPVQEEEEKPKPPPRDHSEAKKIYESYLKRSEELEAHRAYADRVVKASAGSGQTPVYPLATMGTDGGALLCDYCRKPIVLEGGQFHGMNADDAWAKHSNPTESWRSWILGGLVVELQVNGTLRIYHGYPGRKDKQCCNVVVERDKKAREDYEKSKPVPNREMLLAFFEDEFPAMTKTERYAMFNKVVDIIYTYDPGYGVNGPSPSSSPTKKS